MLTYFVTTLGVEAVSPPPDGCYPNFTTAEGCDALFSLITGAGNTAVGWRSLYLDSTGNYNTGIGAGALNINNGDSNTAVGATALLLNTIGAQNTALGTGALVLNDTGSFNTAIGAFALFSNTIGGSNTAVGDSALLRNTEGTNNVAIGANGVLASNLTGNTNTAIGLNALSSNTTGSFNVALGVGAGNSVTTGDNNICIGTEVFGNLGESNAIHIGDSSVPSFTATACFIGGIFDQTATEGAAVFVNSSGQLGTLTSSARFKKEIKPIDDASEALFSLKPVAFRYKNEIDPAGTSQFGLVAEDVDKVNPDLVVRDKEGNPYSVRYEMVNAMLLNEFLKEHKKTEKLEATVASLIATVKEQAAQIQRVSAQVELNKPAPETALNNR